MVRDRSGIASAWILLLLLLLQPSDANDRSAALGNVSVGYPETESTYVSYPNSASNLLAKEAQSLASSKALQLEVRTTVTHWNNPLWHLLRGIIQRFRSRNQLLTVKPYFFVVNGVDMGCRVNHTDGNTAQSVTATLDKDYCSSACTNGFRYCMPNIPSNIVNLINGSMIVEETLRRLCWDEVYRTENITYFEYLDNFEEMKCWQAEDMRACAEQAMSEIISIAPQVINACMDSTGGLKADRVNNKLQEQLDRQSEPPGYRLGMMPMVYINGAEYVGDWNTDSLLQQICFAFQVEDIMPLACDFCSSCDDSRHCLWYWECNDFPFGPIAFQGASNTSTNTNGEMAQGNETASTQSSHIEEEDRYLIGGVIVGLVVGLVPAIYYSCRARRTRKILKAARAMRTLEGSRSEETFNGNLSISAGPGRTPEGEAEEDISGADDVVTFFYRSKRKRTPPRTAFASTKSLEDSGTEATFDDSLSITMSPNRPSEAELEDLDDVDLEVNNIAAMMIQHGAPLKLFCLPKLS